MRLMRLLTKVRHQVAATPAAAAEGPVDGLATAPAAAKQAGTRARTGGLGAVLEGAGLGLGVMALAAGVATHAVGQRLEAKHQQAFAQLHGAMVQGGMHAATRQADSALYQVAMDLDGLRTRVVAASVAQSVLGASPAADWAVSAQVRHVRERLAALRLQTAGADSAFAASVQDDVAYTRDAIAHTVRLMAEAVTPATGANVRHEIALLAQSLGTSVGPMQVAVAQTPTSQMGRAGIGR